MGVREIARERLERKKERLEKKKKKNEKERDRAHDINSEFH